MLKYPMIQDDRSKEESLRLARALFLIGHMEETKPAVEWLKKESSRLAMSSCSNGDDIGMRHEQGAVLLIEDFLKKVATADDTRNVIDGNRGPA